MPDQDRLSAIVDRFRLIVSPVAPENANLAVFGTARGAASRVVFLPDAGNLGKEARRALLTVRVDWGGRFNPLVAALPKRVEHNLSEYPLMADVASLMCAEARNRRCGLHSVISRLGEVLVVHMLRARIAAGSTQPGLVAGLSDPRLSRAVVAMHDDPGRPWRREELAEIAGMSLSRFCEVFHDRVGEAPSAYLRRWRLVLARQDLRRGDRIDAIARRYGYGSPEGFARAFRKRYGRNPASFRHEIAA